MFHFYFKNAQGANYKKYGYRLNNITIALRHLGSKLASTTQESALLGLTSAHSDRKSALLASNYEMNMTASPQRQLLCFKEGQNEKNEQMEMEKQVNESDSDCSDMISKRKICIYLVKRAKFSQCY